jgi:hypothetical protein
METTISLPGLITFVVDFFLPADFGPVFVVFFLAGDISSSHQSLIPLKVFYTLNLSTKPVSCLASVESSCALKFIRELLVAISLADRFTSAISFAISPLTVVLCATLSVTSWIPLDFSAYEERATVKPVAQCHFALAIVLTD